jgi:tellurite resistance protein TerC
VFYLFGLILLLTAGNMLKPESEESHTADNIMVRLARKVFHTTDYYDGDKLFTMHEGKRAMTPMLLVMVAIGGTDILFALDSIPAIFGLTQNTYIVFTATAFSLLVLRQLFFLIDGLLDRLIYLSYGLAAILAFIGVKLILHALHENNVPIINNGVPVPVVEISTGLSLTVILGVLLLTVTASLLSPAGKAQNAIANARRHATSYLDSEYTADPAERERIFRLLLAERDQIVALGPRYRQRVRDEPALMALLERARDSHDAAVANGEAAPAGEPKILPRP